MTRINEIPPFVEEITIENNTEQTIQEILNRDKFKQPIPDKFVKLTNAKKNNWGSTEDLDKPSLLLAEREEVEGAITIENEKEVFIDKPVSEKNAKEELVKRLEELKELRKKVKQLEVLQSKKVSLEEKVNKLEEEIQEKDRQVNHREELIKEGMKIKEQLQKELEEIKTKKRDWRSRKLTQQELQKIKDDVITEKRFPRSEKEKLKNQEAERIKQEQQKVQAEEAKRKNQEEEVKRKEQEFKKRVDEEKKETNPKNDKETGLDNDLQDAKTELQIIKDKLEPYWKQITPITLRGKATKEKLEGLEKHELENYDPQQQAENQKKIEEKEKELEEIRKRFKSEENKQFQISPQILSKFQSTPSFETNTKEKIEALINPIKDNPEFLQEVQTKYQVEDLSSLLANKTPKEVIIIVKRFEYENLSLRDKETKDKEIETYYQKLNQLAKNGKLTEKQINEYLCLEATNRLEKNLISNNKSGTRKDSNKSVIEIVKYATLTTAGVFFTIALVAFVLRHLYHQIRRKKAKKVYRPTYPKNISENELSKLNDLNEE
ncbi:10594_t:CDS:2 [Ambispora leptoticha]|uniref:10594_t:CDS:1 n=1 Tax=Ambispora leptoticha TaxID=144679 RepID=A0A9N9GN22_9GLOM|nr:10594_t:CDS:2 [Ambispora leptoticha]